MKQTKLTFRLFITSILMLLSFSQIQGQGTSLQGPSAEPGKTITYTINIGATDKSFSGGRYLRPYTHIYVNNGVILDRREERTKKTIHSNNLNPITVNIKWNECDSFYSGQGPKIILFPSACPSITFNQNFSLGTVQASCITPSPDFPFGGGTIFPNTLYDLKPSTSEKADRRRKKQEKFVSDIDGLINIIGTSCENAINLARHLNDPNDCYNLVAPSCPSVCEEAQNKINTINNNNSLTNTKKLEQILKIFKDNPSCDLEYCD